jgi:hypothetical protein
MLPIPEGVWQKRIAAVGNKIEKELSFMEEDHRRIHHFVVRELPHAGMPLPAKRISESLEIPVDRVTDILDELESRMVFLARNNERSVVWAYPVTVEETHHHVTFDTGEKLYAA